MIMGDTVVCGLEVVSEASSIKQKSANDSSSESDSENSHQEAVSQATVMIGNEEEMKVDPVPLRVLIHV